VARDPQTGRQVVLFYPRRQRWKDHFRWDGVRVVGLTAKGRATIAALRLNHALILAIRAEEPFGDGIRQPDAAFISASQRRANGHRRRRAAHRAKAG
jgi:hypothetical protein